MEEIKAEIVTREPEELDVRKDSDVFPLADEAVFPGLTDVGLMKAAYRKWMESDSTTLDEAAEAAGADPRTVAYWADVGDWLTHRLRTIRVRGKESAIALERKRQEMREERVMKQIHLATSLGDKIHEALKHKKVVVTREGDTLQLELAPKELKELAEAAKASGDMLGRFLGIAEPKQQALPQDQNADGSDAGGEGSQRPLVVVVRGGGLPQIRMTPDNKGAVIDV